MISEEKQLINEIENDIQALIRKINDGHLKD